MSIYLVTGAAGFVGAAIAKRLINQEHRVISIDNLTTGYLENVPDGVEFFQADCQDPGIYSEIPQIKYDAIFHIAGQSSGEVSFDDPFYDLRSNTETTLRLLKTALLLDCRRFIYASTMSVYGVKPDRPISEEELAVPTSFYGVGKFASEHYLRLYENYGINSTSLRLFNVYGPGQNLKNMRQGMVSIFMAQMLERNDIHIKGSGDRFRDFVYIDDVVDAFLSCLDHAKSIGNVINVGTGVRTTVNDVVQKLIKKYKKGTTYRFEGNTPGDLHGIYANISKAKSMLDFQPKYSLDKGLDKMLLWAKGKDKQ